MHDDFSLDKYEQYADQFDESRHDRHARRARKPRMNKSLGQSWEQTAREVSRVVDADQLEAGFSPTYSPSRHEAEWLLSSLRGFYDRALITDVLGLVKGGKEASVYRCAAHPSTGVEMLAAKVYRPRKFRSLSNDALYREGRAILTESGKAVKKTDHRIMRALNKKTAFGVEVAHTSWLMHEFTTLQRLHEAGASTPRPFASGDNALLMSYHGDETLPAPTLIEISLAEEEAQDLFDEVMRNIGLMLRMGMVHGDLSAYNILYWQGQVTLIDFPQVVSSEANRQAFTIFRRDVRRVCDYFRRQGVGCDPDALAESLWAQHAPPSAAMWADEESAG